MPLSSFSRKTVFCWCLVLGTPTLLFAQAHYATNGGEHAIAGIRPGTQTHPRSSIRSTGGYLVWEDDATDGDGLGISALRLDSTLSGTLSAFRVNQISSGDQ